MTEEVTSSCMFNKPSDLPLEPFSTFFGRNLECEVPLVGLDGPEFDNMVVTENTLSYDEADCSSQEFEDSNEIDDEETIKKNGRNLYRHIPHRDKPVHVVQKRNARERRRVQSVNWAFNNLRKAIPYLSGRSKRISKVRTLQAAIDYINCLTDILNEDDNPNHNDRTISANNSLITVSFGNDENTFSVTPIDASQLSKNSVKMNKKSKEVKESPSIKENNSPNQTLIRGSDGPTHTRILEEANYNQIDNNSCIYEAELNYDQNNAQITEEYLYMENEQLLSESPRMNNQSQNYQQSWSGDNKIMEMHSYQNEYFTEEIITDITRF